MKLNRCFLNLQEKTGPNNNLNLNSLILIAEALILTIYLRIKALSKKKLVPPFSNQSKAQDKFK